MGLREDIPLLIARFKELKPQLDHNYVLFDISEGNLLPYVLADLKNELNERSFRNAMTRCAPINVLNRIMSKLSKLYAEAPTRKTLTDLEQDQELVSFYESELDLNVVGAEANEAFNRYKYTALEPYAETVSGKLKPRLRVLPSNRFFVYSTDEMNPTRVTHFVKIMGKKKQVDGQDSVVFYAYTDEEFLAFDEQGRIQDDVMSKEGIRELEGKNPVGKIPFVYISRSRQLLIPKPDTDLLAMVKLIPVILTDINYALKMMSFGIIAIIDADNEELTRSPDVAWMLKSDPNSDKTPQVVTIKPEVDSDKYLDSLKAQIALWLESKNIKPGSMGKLSMESAASGLAKMVDEIDTSEDRQAQVPHFVKAERDLFSLLINHLHPYWSQEREYQEKRQFSPGCEVVTEFSEQRPIVDSSKVIADEKAKLEMGLQTKEGAIKAINPDWDDEMIKDHMQAISTEKVEVIEQTQPDPVEAGV